MDCNCQKKKKGNGIDFLENTEKNYESWQPYLLCYVQVSNHDALEALDEHGEDGLKEYIYSRMWNPEYRWVDCLAGLATSSSKQFEYAGCT